MPVNIEHHVNFYDTDAMAVVHHANYIRWFEIGRVAYLRSIGITLTEMMDDGYVFPITDISAKYVSPGRFDDDLIIETTATALTKVKMCFKYRILRKETGELLGMSIEDDDVEAFYGKYSDMLDDALNGVAEELSRTRSGDDVRKLALSLAVRSYADKLLSRELISMISEGKDGE